MDCTSRYRKALYISLSFTLTAIHQLVTAAMQSAVYPHWVQCLAQGHFSIWTVEAVIWTTNPSIISLQPALPNERQLQLLRLLWGSHLPSVTNACWFLVSKTQREPFQVSCQRASALEHARSPRYNLVWLRIHRSLTWRAINQNTTLMLKI